MWPSFRILVLWYKWILAALTLHPDDPVQILGLLLCMVFLIDLLTYPYQKREKKLSGYFIWIFEQNNYFALQVKKFSRCNHKANYFTYILGIA